MALEESGKELLDIYFFSITLRIAQDDEIKGGDPEENKLWISFEGLRLLFHYPFVCAEFTPFYRDDRQDHLSHYFEYHPLKE